jgi:uncharacterized protein YkwD
MLTLPDEKRKKAKSSLIKISVIIVLTILFAGFSYFTIASKFIRNEPAKSYPSVSQSISNMPERFSDTKTSQQETEVVNKNISNDNYGWFFSKEIATDNSDNFTGNEQDAPSTQEQDKKTQVQTVTGQEDTGIKIDNAGLESFTVVLLNMINTARLGNGLPALNANPAINVAAQYRSQDMIDRNYFSHQTPDGKNINNILCEFGVMYAACGENIQYASPSSWANPELFFDSWMNSDLHRANILSGTFSQIGIGISNNNDRVVAVLVFIN